MQWLQPGWPGTLAGDPGPPSWWQISNAGAAVSAWANAENPPRTINKLCAATAEATTPPMKGRHNRLNQLLRLNIRHPKPRPSIMKTVKFKVNAVFRPHFYQRQAPPLGKELGARRARLLHVLWRWQPTEPVRLGAVGREIDLTSNSQPECRSHCLGNQDPGSFAVRRFVDSSVASRIRDEKSVLQFSRTVGACTRSANSFHLNSKWHRCG